MEIIWTVLAQTLSPPQPESITVDATLPEEEAAAANRVWTRLMRKPISDQDVAEGSKGMLDKIAGYAIRCYTDLLMQIESMDDEPSLDTYAWETMSESLVNSFLPHANFLHLFCRPETSFDMLCSAERDECRSLKPCKTASK